MRLPGVYFFSADKKPSVEHPKSSFFIAKYKALEEAAKVPPA
jgi:hypothetical protein